MGRDDSRTGGSTASGQAGPDEIVPHEIGPYEIEERLGAGGMGEVFRAYDRRLGRRVALKHVRPADTGSAKRRARLRREAWSAAQLSHPAIVQIYDILEDPEGGGDGDWIVMEFVPGPTLAALAARGPLALPLAVRLARQVAEGLAAAHRRGVIHRDLKAENVMVADGQAKILDFGLAKPVDAADAATWTGSGAVVGTARAMSPEQARGRKVDFRTDLFSLGTLIYELVSGTSPFLGDGPASTLTRVCSHQPAPLAEAREGIPEQLSRLVDRLLQKIPEARPESAAATAGELAAIEDVLEPAGEETLAPPVTALTERVAEMETVFRSDLENAPAPSAPPPWTAETGLSRIVRRHPLMTLGGVLVAALGLVLVALLPGAPADSFEGDSVEPGVATFESGDPGTAYDALRRGDALLARHDRPGHVEQALDVYRQAFALGGDHAPALAGMARAAWRKFLDGREELWLDEALAAAERAVDLDPQLLRARRSLALVLIERGEYERAQEEVERLLRLDPDDAESHWVLGRLLVQRDQMEDAEAAFRRAMELAPDEAEYPFELAVLKQAQGDYDGAEELLLRALGLAPDNAYAYYSLGVMSYFRGEISEAIDRFQRSIEIRPSPAAYSNIGTLYFFRGFYDEAVQALEKAVEHGAAGHVVWSNLGDAYRWAGRADEAEEAYGEAVERLRSRLDDHPGSPDLRSRLALILAKTGDPDGAVGQLRSMSENAASWRDDASVLYRRAVTWELGGERERALGELRSALAAGYPVAEVESDPELDSLRADPVFEPAPG